MARRIDWEARLGAYLDSVRDVPHSYGRHDCAIFTANAVKAQTGRDFARGMRGRYKSAATSIRFVHSLGYDDLAALVTAKLGEPIAPAFAQRGDVVMTGEGALGICMGSLAFFVGRKAIAPAS